MLVAIAAPGFAWGLREEVVAGARMKGLKQFLREDPNVATRAFVLPDLEREQRAKEVAHGTASVRLEGLEPSDDAKALLQRYVDGELSSEDLDRAFDALFSRKYGPIRLPGD